MADSRKFSLIDFRRIGLGDCVSGLLVLSYLSCHDRSQFPGHCTVLVPDQLENVARHLLSQSDLAVGVTDGEKVRGAPGRCLMPRAPMTVSDVREQILGTRLFLNWAEACQLETAWESIWPTWSVAKKLRFLYLELTQFRTIDPRAAAPLYVGFRLLFPLLMRSTRTVAAHVFHARGDFPRIRSLMAAYASAQIASSDDLSQEKKSVIIFPGAESFNTMPIALCMKLQDRFGEAIRFALHESDASFREAKSCLKNLVTIRTVEETLRLISRNYAISVDSFVSHLIQMTTNEATLIFTRELRERFTHPGAGPRILEMFPSCAPCAYKSRKNNKECPAGMPICIAFDALYPRLEAEIDHAVSFICT